MRLAAASILLVLWALASACAPAAPKAFDPATGPGVTFTYPLNGQWDVPVGARLVVHLNAAVDPSVLHGTCSVAAGGQVQGAFCIQGPSGTLAPELSVAGGGNVILAHAPLEAGTTYAVYVRPSVLGGPVATSRMTGRSSPSTRGA